MLPMSEAMAFLCQVEPNPAGFAPIREGIPLWLVQNNLGVILSSGLDVAGTVHFLRN
jgi:hypothetical protein